MMHRRRRKGASVARMSFGGQRGFFGRDDILRLVEEQALPARRLGNEWRFLKAAIQDWLWLSPPPKSNKQAWMELAGVWKDDPYVEEELTEIYRRRGRPTIEDES